MSGPVPDYINWIGFVATVVGLLVSGVGLFATYRQARDAKEAAQAAESAANSAISKLRTRTMISNLASGMERVQIIRSHILVDNFDAARSLFGFCLKDFKEIFYTIETSGEISLPTDIEQALKQISITLDDEKMSQSKKIAVMRALREVSDTMSSHYAKSLWTDL